MNFRLVEINRKSGYGFIAHPLSTPYLNLCVLIYLQAITW